MTAHAIDEEVRRVIDDAYAQARKILDRQPRQAAHHGGGAHQVRDHRRGAAEGHHGRPRAASRRATGTTPARRPSGQAARRSRSRSSARRPARPESPRAGAPRPLPMPHARSSARMRLQCGRFRSTSTTPVVMGVLNVTPDSFSDGGRFLDLPRRRRAAPNAWRGGRRHHRHRRRVDAARAQRPSSAEEELRRVMPVVERLAATLGVPVSVDTSKPEVMRARDRGRRVDRQRRRRARRAGRARGRRRQRMPPSA